VDVHAHFSGPAMPRVGTKSHSPSDYRRATRGLDLRFTGALAMARRGETRRTSRMNDTVLRWAHTPANRFYAVCSVHPADGAQALAEVDRVARAGARGLKLHPNTQHFDVADPAVAEVVTRAAERRLPVLFDAYSPFDANQIGKFVQLAIQVPKAHLVLAHAHGPRFAELLVYDVLARYEWWGRNVWVDLSVIGPLLAGSPFAEQFSWVLHRVGADRLLFGSDYPFDDPVSAVRAIASLAFSPRELRQIFATNARRLYRLD
jgi:predicted TIM-barrel fold metal-dependent hydrolase